MTLSNPADAAARARVNRRNLYELFQALQASPFFEYQETDGLTRWSCALPYAWFNAVRCARAATPADAEFVDTTLAYFRGRATPAITWWLEDGVDRLSWDALLVPRGFAWDEGPAGMSRTLDPLPAAAPLPSGVSIRLVTDAAEVRDCARMVLEGYEFPPAWSDVTVQFLEGLAAVPAYQSYVAYWNGAPVATAGVLYGRSAAGIYTVATAPAARGQGLGYAVTRAPLVEAQRRGYATAILQASAMGYPVYQRMGFRDDARIGSYFYSFA